MYLHLFCMHIDMTRHGHPAPQALSLFKDAENNLRPDQQLLEVSLGACAVGGQWQLAIELLQRCRWGPETWWIEKGEIKDIKAGKK